MTETASGISAAEKPSPMATLSRRMIGYTNNLVATAIVLVIGLSGGRELVSWWRADLPGAVTMTQPWPTIDWSAPLQSCSLQFGSAPLAIDHATIAGDREQAISKLQRRCRKVLASGPPPLGALGPAETELLAQLQQRKPVEQQAGQWRMYQTQEPVPLTVGVVAGSRVAAWGMAVPAADGNWTTYTIRAATELPDDLLPSDCRRTLAVTDAHGATLFGFTSGNATSIMQHYDDRAKQFRWQTVMPWQSHANTWQARYLRGESPREAIEIHLALDQANILRGIVTCCPIVPPQEATP